MKTKGSAKLFVWILCLLLLSATVVVSAEVNTSENDNYSWYNESSKEFTINTAGQMKALANIVSGKNTPAGIAQDNFLNKTVKLGADIDLSNTNLDTIGLYGNNTYFKGTFDGQNHSITNLNSSTNDHAGLFGAIASPAVIKNVKVEGTVSSVNIAGGIVGMVKGDSTNPVQILNCTYKGTVNGGANAGGIVGSAEYCTIQQCGNYATVSASGADSSAGGIVGHTSYDFNLKNCFNRGTITGDGNRKIGGLVGNIYKVNANTSTTIQNCYSSGTVSGSGNKGMLVGVFDEGAIASVSNCYYLSDLDVDSDLRVGPFGSSAPTGCTGDAKTTTAFESGEVAYTLQNNLGTDGQVVWGQENPGTSGSYPVFSNTRLWQVTFQSKDGTSTYENLTKYVKNEGTINSLPTEVSGITEGFTLCGWNTEKNNGGESFDITTPITTNTTLYARVKETRVYTLSMDTYVIGNPMPTPRITPDPGNATVTFYYKANSDLIADVKWEEWNASNVSIDMDSSYRMIAKVAETAEYAPCTTDETTFSALHAVAKVTADGTTTGFLTFQQALDAVKQANHGTLKLLQSCYHENPLTINNNMTLDLNDTNLGADITISGGTVTLTGNGNISGTLDITGGTVKLEGGTYEKIVVSTGNTLNSLLAEGKAFRQNDDQKWIYADNTATTLLNVSVKNVPLRTITASGGGIYSYGETVNLTTAVTKDANITEEPTYQWYTVSGEVKTKINGAESATYTPKTLDVGTYTYCVTATVDGYTLMKQDITVTVNTATLTENMYSVPIANNRTYNAQEQNLVSTPIHPNGTSVQYRLTQNDQWSTTIPKAKNAENYTVYWRLLGGTNYHDITPTDPITVTIAQKNIQDGSNETEIIVKQSTCTYDGTAKTPTITAVMLDKTAPVGSTPLENMVEGKDYTLNITPQTNADTYNMTLTGIGNYTGTLSSTWTLGKATYGNQTATGSAKYGATGMVDLSNLIMSGGTVNISTDNTTVLDGTPTMTDTKLKFAFKDDSTLKDQTATITISITNCTNYADYTITVTVTVTDKMVPLVTANNITSIYTGSDIPTSAITGTATFNGQPVTGSWSFTNAAPRNVADSNNSVSVTFTPDDTANFNAATATINVTITKATPKGAPTYTAITAMGKKLTDAALAVGTITPDGGIIAWELANDTEVTANTPYQWIYTPSDTANYNTLKGDIILWSISSGGSGGNSNKIEISTNPDGSTTTTVTKPVGSITTTDTKPDGSVTETTKKPDGSVTATTQKPDGSKIEATIKTEIKADGSSSVKAETNISEKAIENAVKNDEAITLPIRVPASKDSHSAATVGINLPKNTKSVKVEIPVENINPGTVIVLVHNDGREEIIKTTIQTENGVQFTITEDVTVKIVDNSKNFTDTEKHWANKYIQAAIARELFKGVSNTEFDANSSMTREMVSTVLARLNGVDTTGGKTWFEKGVAWAIKNGISDGTNGSAEVTREQLITMLYRYAGEPSVQGDISGYSDSADVSHWSTKAMTWAVSAGIINGTDNGQLLPQGNASRGEVAAILMRFINLAK